MDRSLAARVLLFIGLAACGTSGSAADDESDSGLSAAASDGAAPTADAAAVESPTAIAASACTVPSSVTAQVDAGAGGPVITVARVYLSCQNPTESCSSNDGARCLGSPAASAPLAGTCVDQCDAEEYVVMMDVGMYEVDGGEAVHPSATLPSACRLESANPGGGVWYCCPCG